MDTTLHQTYFVLIGTAPLHDPVAEMLNYNSKYNGQGEIMSIYQCPGIYNGQNQYAPVNAAFLLKADFAVIPKTDWWRVSIGSVMHRDELSELLFHFAGSFRLYEAPHPNSCLSKLRQRWF